MRYLVLAALVVAAVRAALALSNKREFNGTDKTINLVALVMVHLQLVLGSLNYFLAARGLQALMNVEGAMKEPMLRYFGVEHITGMLIAIVLITVGYSKAKRAATSQGKHKAIALYFTLGLLLIFVMIPWPFLKDFGTWI